MARYLLPLKEHFYTAAMKKGIIFGIGLVWGCTFLQAQSDFSTTRPLRIGERNNLDIPVNPSGTTLRMPSVLDESLISNNNNSDVKMLPDRELLQAGYDLEIDPKIGDKEKKNVGTYFGNQSLGNVKTTARFVGIVCRDHEYVDGDRIKIYVNGEVVEFNLLLSGSFKGVNVDLVEGFNHIEFEALNQGSSGPNTAQVMVTDDKGTVIHNNRWNLSTGSRANLVVVKEK